MRRFAFCLAPFCLALTTALASPAVLAKVPANEADQLRTRLTPLGGERAGNAAGTIPEWRGGQTAAPPCHVRGRRYCDPFSGQQPYLVITAENADQWSNQLSAGQLQMLQRHAQTYRIPVYPSQRSFANPGAVYEAAHRNALNAVLSPSGEAVREASLAVPFPITKDGTEMIWNHRLRYRGPGYSRWFSHAAVTGTGDLHLTRMREDAEFPYTAPDTMEDGIMQRWLQIVREPERLHGYVNLIFDTLDPDEKPQNTWRQVPEQRVVRLRTFGADNPAMLSEDLRFDDQHDGFFGSPGRYTWRLVQKREMFVPYNSYALHGSRESIRDIIQPGHLKPELTRYELHRVWVVEALLKPSATHRAKRRTFYIDEDSWQILMVDLYDRADRLWRWQETHTMMAYDRATLIPAAETFYDLDTARYLVMSIDEGDPERIETTFDDKRFTPSGARAQAPR